MIKIIDGKLTRVMGNGIYLVDESICLFFGKFRFYALEIPSILCSLLWSLGADGYGEQWVNSHKNGSHVLDAKTTQEEVVYIIKYQ